MKQQIITAMIAANRRTCSFLRLVYVTKHLAFNTTLNNLDLFTVTSRVTRSHIKCIPLSTSSILKQAKTSYPTAKSSSLPNFNRFKKTRNLTYRSPHRKDRIEMTGFWHALWYPQSRYTSGRKSAGVMGFYGSNNQRYDNHRYGKRGFSKDYGYGHGQARRPSYSKGSR